MSTLLKRTFGPSVTEVEEARHFTSEALAAWGLVSDDTVLVVSEIASNALCHAGGGFVLTLRLWDEAVVVEVIDSSNVMPQSGAPAGSGRRGRGLLIVEGVARQWGFQSGPGAGKTVWAEVSVQHSSPGLRLD